MRAGMQSRSQVQKRSVAWVYRYAETFGGSFNSLLDVLDHRDQTAFDLTAVLPAPGSSSRHFEARGVPADFCDLLPGERSWRFLRAVLAFGALIRRQTISLVYFPDYGLWRSSALVGARLVRAPTVIHLRSPISQGHARDPWLCSANAIIGNSQATVQALRGRVADGKIHVIYNFIDFDAFGPGPNCRANFFPEQHPLVGFVGLFRPEKGVEYFLQMARILNHRLPEVRFLAVGGDSPVRPCGWFEKMQNLASTLGISDVVRFAGHRSDIPTIMRSLDVLVVPSLNEGFGRVIIEANAVGVPVVGAAAAAIPEIIEDGVTGLLVPARDPASMAEAVVRVLGDPEWKGRVSEVAPVRVRERFSPALQVGKIEDVWRLVLGMSRN